MSGLITHYQDSDTFTTETDMTRHFLPDVRIKADCTSDGYRYSKVLSSSYDSGTNLTTVILTENILTSNLFRAWFSGISAGPTGVMPIHIHTDDNQGGYIINPSYGLITNSLGTVSADTDIDLTAYRCFEIEPQADIVINFINLFTSRRANAVLAIKNGGDYSLTFKSLGILGKVQVHKEFALSTSVTGDHWDVLSVFQFNTDTIFLKINKSIKVS